MGRGLVRLRSATLFTASLLAAPLVLTACGGRFTTGAQESVGTHAHRTLPSQAGTGSPGPARTTPSGDAGGDPDPATAPSGARAATTTPPAALGQRPSTADPSNAVEKAIVTAYETYLVDLSGLDDTLSRSYVAPLASVTTTRLAQATVRQAAALQAAHEHGVGTLRDDHVTVVTTGPASAALADCQDEEHFVVVRDGSGTPDTFVAHGDYAGSAQLVLQGGHWLVDVFSTTQVGCTF